MAEQIKIAQLDIDTDALIASATKTREEIDKLRQANKELAKQGKKNTEEYTKNEIAVKKLSASYNKQKNVLTQLTDENNKTISTEKAMNQALSRNIKTIDDARNSNKELLAMRNKLDLSSKEGQKQMQMLNQKLDQNNEFIKQNVSAYEQQKIGIGNYEGALRRVFPQLGGFVDGLKKAKANLVAQKAAMQGATAATGAGSKALKLFRIALISTGIGAIVVALGSLVAAFASTQKGIDFINQALAPLKGAFQGIIGVAQDLALNVFSQLSDRFTIVKNGMLVGIDLIRIGWNKLTGDVEEANKIQEQMKERLKEAREAQIRLNKKTEEFSNIWKGAGKRISDAAKAQLAIERLQISIENSEIRLVKSRAESMRIIREQKKIAEDLALSVEAREKAATRAMEETKNLLREEQKILDQKIRQAKLQNSMNDTDRDAKLELAKLEAERIDKETQMIKLQTTLQVKLNTIRKEADAKEKAELDQKIEKEMSNYELELELFRRNHQSKLDQNKFFNEAMLKQEVDRLNKLEEKEKEYLNKKRNNGLISENEYQLGIDAIDRDFTQKRDEVKKQREEAEKEKQIIDLENKRLLAEENFLTDLEIRQNQLDRQEEQELANAKKTGASLVAIKKKFKLRREKLENDTQKAIVASNENAIGQIGNLARTFFGENKALMLAIAGADLWIGVQKAYNSQLVPGDPSSKARAFAAAVKAGIFGAKNVASIAATKYEKGGLQEIGGKRHSQGGTKFYGEDGTSFEAEKGELIGVMSRQASKAFMSFNDAYTPNALSSSLKLGKYRTGGLISPVSNSARRDAQNTLELGNLVSAEVNKIKIVQVVEDFNDVNGAMIENRARADV